MRSILIGLTVLLSGAALAQHARACAAIGLNIFGRQRGDGLTPGQREIAGQQRAGL